MAASFHDLSANDRGIKLRKRQQIEAAWNCPIQSTIPASIRPRAHKGRGSIKAKTGSSVPEAEWWAWSVQLLYKLENLSALTKGRLAFAQEIMVLEVRRRQGDLTEKYREVAEILKADLQKIIQELRERGKANSREDELENGGGGGAIDLQDEDENESDTEVMNGAHDHDFEMEIPGTMIKSEPLNDNDVEMLHAVRTEEDVEILPTIKTEPDVSTVAGSSITTAATKGILKTRAQIATLRADAMRLRQEASRREAEAYEMEAKMLRAEARAAAG